MQNDPADRYLLQSYLVLCIDRLKCSAQLIILIDFARQTTEDISCKPKKCTNHTNL